MTIKKISLFALCLAVCLTGIFQTEAAAADMAAGRKKAKAVSEEEKFIDGLLEKMTLKEKIGQLSQYVGRDLLTGPKSEMLTDSLLERGMVGSILNVGGVDRLRAVQKKNMEKSRMKIPILFAFDVIHGFKTLTPTPLAESCSWDLDMIYQSAKNAAIEASASGIMWTFAPMVDIARDPRWGRIVEGAGEDPFLASKIADARVRGFQWNLGEPDALMACAKHFVAYGAPQAGRDYAPVDISNSTLREVYLPPYQACIDAGVETVMSAFHDLNGLPASGSKWLLTDVLRTQMGFKGFVVSDWAAVEQLVVQGVVKDKKEAGELAINAGLDMDMTDGVYNAYLEQSVKEGIVSEEVIDESVRRILRAKYRLGLFEDPYRFFSNERENREVKSSRLMEFSRDMARKSIVLLKNANRTLPLSREIRKIAVIGPLGDNQNELQGSWKARADAEDVVTVLQGIKNKLPEAEVTYAKGCDFAGEDRSGFAKAMKVARGSDVIIMAVGEKALFSGESRSRAYLTLPGVQEELIDSLKTLGKPLVICLFNGRPLVLKKPNEAADALVEAWFPGTQAGNALADVLFGDYNPSGKLTTSFPVFEGQIPNYYNYKRSGRPGDMEQSSTVRHIDLKNANLFPFGYGLSYTEFKYSNFLCPEQFDENGILKVSVDVTNTGDYDGEEIVQVYVSDLVASMTRPVKELKGFKKVFIPKGETVRVEVEIDARDLGFWTNSMEYRVEPGDFLIMIGPDSENLQTKTASLHKI
ncbi:glycoside hydrolase family 3 N-terminal domain-containing protein [Alistipes shahii]|uniref:glycoside hydrolase family 3 N-terminal domain-containing protein n=1 Tax=Alistipes shahii TaxID=328814 RepID=UPI00266EB941|nr:glycoside hydrolase family 3 N-terminal domain-containing protein [Alistipes shahii]